MQKRIVFGALSLFLEMSLVVVFVSAFETKAAIGSENLAAGKAARIIQLITNCLPEFAILASSRGHRFVLRIVEFVNGA